MKQFTMLSIVPRMITPDREVLVQDASVEFNPYAGPEPASRPGTIGPDRPRMTIRENISAGVSFVFVTGGMLFVGLFLGGAATGFGSWLRGWTAIGLMICVILAWVPVSLFVALINHRTIRTLQRNAHRDQELLLTGVERRFSTTQDHTS